MENQTEHVLRTRAEGLTAQFLELRPKPGRSNNKNKSFLMRVGLVERLWLTIQTCCQQAERHPQHADEAEMKPVAVQKTRAPVRGSCDE